ncbi:MAG: pyruvate ferredoxin oxidoreductase, partial [Ruminiclostridium sp.]|nr:pyruvate ferredoxin oxidoreductase [Ruminiclostridium sp.]
RHAKTIPSYGHERRGAPVFSDVIIDDKNVLLSSFIYEPDVVVVFDPFIENKEVNIKKGIHPDTILVINSALAYVVNNTCFKSVYFVNATQISLERAGNGIPNAPMLGALAKAGIVRLDSVCKCVGDFFKKTESNIIAQVVEEAYEKTKKL